MIAQASTQAGKHVCHPSLGNSSHLVYANKCMHHYAFSLLVLKSIRRSDSPDIFFLISLIGPRSQEEATLSSSKNSPKEILINTVDGRNLTQVDRQSILIFAGFYSSQVDGRGFFHPLCKLHGYGSCKEFHVWWTFGDELRDTAGRWLLCIGCMAGFVKGWKFGCIHIWNKGVLMYFNRWRATKNPKHISRQNLVGGFNVFKQY